MRNTEKMQENTENMQQTARGFRLGVSANAPSKENVGEALVPKRIVDRVGESEYTGYSK